MKKFLRWLDHSFEEWILGVLLIGIAVILMLQIIMRSVIGVSLTWAEEIARYFYVWSVFLSLGYTIRINNILRVDLLLDCLPKQIRKVVEIALDALSAALYLYFAYYSVSVVSKVQISGQTSPALEIQMYLVYAIIPFGFALASLRSVQKIYLDLTGKTETFVEDYSEAV